jgi:hypothetical protein
MSNKERINENTAKIEELAKRLEEVNLKQPTLITKEITENGTYNASDDNADGFDSVVVNVAGSGGGESNLGLLDLYNGWLEKQTPTYNKSYDTTDNVTLYTPAEGFDKYYIFKRQDGVYRVVWTNSTYPMVLTVNQLYVNGLAYLRSNYAPSGMYGLYFATKIELVLKELNSYTGISAGMSVYYSQDFSTLEDAINGIKSKDTTYTNTTSGLSSFPDDNEPTTVKVTNYIEINKFLQINECGRQLSSNENIVVIS